VNGYREVVDQRAADALLDRMAGFHDALVKEFHFVSRAWIDAERAANLHSGRDLRVLVQSQVEPGAIELLCICVAELVLEQDPDGINDTEPDGAIDVRGASGPDDRPSVRVEIGNGLRVVCQRLLFAERPEWAGPAARLGGDVPPPDAVPAHVLDDETWKCGACSATFAVTQRSGFASCPACRRLVCVAPPPSP